MRICQLKFELQTIQHKNLTMTEDLRKIKSLFDNLSVVGYLIKETDIVFYPLSDLGSNFEPFVISVTSQIDIITMKDLHHLLLTWEHRLALTTQLFSLDISSTTTVNIANRTIDKPFLFNNASRGSSNRGQGQDHGCESDNDSYNKQHVTWNSSSSNNGHPQCLICNKWGHTALQCYNRFNKAYQPPSPPIDNLTCSGNSSISK